MGRNPRSKDLELTSNAYLIWLFKQRMAGIKLSKEDILLAREANTSLNYSKAKLATQVIKQDTTVREEIDIDQLMKELAIEETHPADAEQGSNTPSLPTKSET